MSEAEEQATVVEYCKLLGLPVYHIPNEGKRSRKTGAYMKAQGLMPGVPDLCIPVARGNCHALYIEMKAQHGKITENQEEWIYTLRSQGNAAFVCYGSSNACDLIDHYLAGDINL